MNTNTLSSVDATQVFVPELVNLETTQEWDMVIASWSPRRAIATLGFLNKLVWKVTTQAGALVKVGDKPSGGSEHKVVERSLKQLAQQSYAGLVGCKFALKGFSEYLTQWWTGAVAPVTALKSIREIRSDLSALGLFDYEDGAVGSRKVPTIWAIDIPLVLQFYRHLERAYLRMTGGELGSLPRHLGSNIVRLFNCLFKGLATYRKLGDESNPVQRRTEATEAPGEGEATTFYGNGKRESFKEFAARKMQWTVDGFASWTGEAIATARQQLRRWAESPDYDGSLDELPF